MKLYESYLEELQNDIKYRITIVEKSLISISKITKYNPIFGDKIDDEWGRFIFITLSLKEIKDVQKLIIKHWKEQTVPWYMDGYQIGDKNKIIIAFGADDGNNGQIFIFNKTDKKECAKFKKYGLSKKIPYDQLNICKEK